MKQTTVKNAYNQYVYYTYKTNGETFIFPNQKKFDKMKWNQYQIGDVVYVPDGNTGKIIELTEKKVVLLLTI
jgi:hypothetical protein